MSKSVNPVSRQIAHCVWVDLSTRKIGLEIDINNDVLTELYQSWFKFLTATRDEIKRLPISEMDCENTQNILWLLIEIVNDGIRPHLTKWSARFRYWYKHLEDESKGISPQKLQTQFPQYDELVADLLRANNDMIVRRDHLYNLVTG